MIKQISSEELKKRMDNDEPFVLVDCREQEEWNASHLPGAKFMPLSEFDEFYPQLKTDQDIVVYCHSGGRSMKACQFLLGNDYENLSNLQGGIMDWHRRGYDLVKD